MTRAPDHRDIRISSSNVGRVFDRVALGEPGRRGEHRRSRHGAAARGPGGHVDAAVRNTAPSSN